MKFNRCVHTPFDTGKIMHREHTAVAFAVGFVVLNGDDKKRILKSQPSNLHTCTTLSFKPPVANAMTGVPALKNSCCNGVRCSAERGAGTSEPQGSNLHNATRLKL